MNRSRRHGMKLVEILVIVGILALLVALVLPAITRLRETSGRMPCPSNLRQIGQALMLYANENKGAFPRVNYNAGVPPVWGTGAAAGNPFFGADRPTDNDVTAAIFLLMRTQDVRAGMFYCPSADGGPDHLGEKAALNRSNFTDWRTNLSYSFANPYPDQAAAKNGYALGSDNSNARFAVAADMNPGVGDGYDVTLPSPTSSAKEMQRANSRNHQGVGQNALFADGHVEFLPTPFGGVKGDNIYTVSGTDNPTGEGTPTSKIVVGFPKGGHDSVLLPAWK